ncbi:hypothetical protein H257_06374 [Aphanomyces astaci]|uniref:Plastocyanin-like domain-containing protein n=1 Tax=Aphanomyces astaci TaxID=112090 RepID=W4GPX1_APHAT|nr:hypothetical protein H257_06374 [Aphanomyces astaci]ETV80928.1 hypothetical protein H257_06374 [Aphanomyces astaci]|eukprot:XP_009829875.1 hypothetical protein H257_06374 [Aphanomyces astaci]
MKLSLTTTFAAGLGTIAVDVSETLVISRGSPRSTAAMHPCFSLTLVNDRDDLFSMHLHGINQVGSPSPTVPPISRQRPCPPYSTATHSSIMTDYGAFFYHSHIKLLDLHFVYGALVVKAPSATDPYAAYEDRVLMLSDYWASDLETLHAGLVDIEDTYVTPKEPDYIKVLPGQRLSFVVTADHPVDNYFWCKPPANGGSVPPPTASPFLHYTDAPPPSTTPSLMLLPPIPETVGGQFPHSICPSFPPRLLRPSCSTKPKSRGGSTVPSGAPCGRAPSALGPFTTGQVVGIVLQNNVALNRVFWVVNSGAGDFDASSSAAASDDRTRAVKRDVESVYPHHSAYNQPPATPASGCGWAKILFVANNVGALALHWHIASHFAMGMAASLSLGGTPSMTLLLSNTCDASRLWKNVPMLIWLPASTS